MLNYCEDRVLRTIQASMSSKTFMKESQRAIQYHSHACHGLRTVKDLAIKPSVFHLLPQITERVRWGREIWMLAYPLRFRDSLQTRAGLLLIVKSDGSRSLCVWVTFPLHELVWVKPEWVLSCCQIDSNLLTKLHDEPLKPISLPQLPQTGSMYTPGWGAIARAGWVSLALLSPSHTSPYPRGRTYLFQFSSVLNCRKQGIIWQGNRLAKLQV